MLLADMTANALFLLGLLVIGVVVRRSFRKRSGRSVTEVCAPKPTKRESWSGPHNSPDQVARWEVQMHDLARDLSGQLDSKIGILRHLVDDAQQAAARLEALAERIEAAQATAHEMACTADDDSRSAVESQRSVGRRYAAGEELAWLTRSAAGAKTAVGHVAGPPWPDARYPEIFRLADAGYSHATIAHQIGSPIGEIELILSVRKKA
jgi:hypothetical protein